MLLGRRITSISTSAQHLRALCSAPSSSIDERFFRSIVKVFATTSAPSMVMPWQNKIQRDSTGSGFISKDRRILTNAHCVANETFLEVRKHGYATKFAARVHHISHESDLAVLMVDDDEFWKDVSPLEFGDLPYLQDGVTVLGYPTGGDNISITSGVVSRLEVQEYVHGGDYLLAIQIDAAINPGNSGGPVLSKDGKVIGIAFQNLSQAENIGYVIPLPIIDRMLKDMELAAAAAAANSEVVANDTAVISEGGMGSDLVPATTTHAGFCKLGVRCAIMDSKAMRNAFGMNCTGMLVTHVAPAGAAKDVLLKDDVLLSIDGHAIANDGTVVFRGHERIAFQYFTSLKAVGESTRLTILRDKKEMELELPVEPLDSLVPPHVYGLVPRFFIYAGFVFVPLSKPYLYSFGQDWYNSAPRHFVRLMEELPESKGEEIVIIAQVLADAENAGYGDKSDVQVKSVNGTKVHSLQHLVELMMIQDSTREDDEDHYHRLDLEDKSPIIIDTTTAAEATERIQQRYRINHSMSEDLRAALAGRECRE